MNAAHCDILLFILEIQKSCQLPVGSKPNMASTTAIAAVGPPLGDKLFPTKTHTTLSAVSSLNKNGRTINKLHSHTCLLNNLSL